MPTYRIPNPRLRDEGPVLRVRVGLPQSVSGRASSEDRHGSEPIEVDALVDTGSGRSVIHPEVARRLDLTPVGSVEIDTPSSMDVPAFRALGSVLVRPNDQRRGQGPRGSASRRPPPALLGRDVLAQGRFLYEGKLGAFTLTF